MFDKKFYNETADMIKREFSSALDAKKKMSKDLDDCITMVNAINRMMERQEKRATA